MSEGKYGFIVLFAAVAISGTLGLFALKLGSGPTGPTKIAHVAEPPHLEPETHNIVTVAGRDLDIGDGRPATAALVSTPTQVAVDFSGNLYIGDSLNNRIRKVDAITGIISTVAGTGAAGSSGDGGLATAAEINGPFGVSFDSGNLYIGEFGGHRVRKVNLATGIISTVAGTGASGFSGDGGQATSAQLNGPRAVGVDSSGNLYIGEFLGHRVRKVNLATGIITTFAGTGVAGFNGDNIQATLALINAPVGLAVDSSSNLYIADRANNRVRKVSLATGIITTFAGTGVAGFNGDNIQATLANLFVPFGVTFDSGNLYIADFGNSRVRKVVLATGIITTIAGITGNFNGDNQAATAANLNSPWGVARDSFGNLYISDLANNRVRKVDANGIITTVAGTGVAGFSGDGGQATAAQLTRPQGVHFDSSGNLYIADFQGARVRKVNLATGIITNFAGTGAGGYNGDKGCTAASTPVETDVACTNPIGDTCAAGKTCQARLATSAKLRGPRSFAFDSSGNDLYISDAQNHRIRKVNLATNIITTVAGTGASGFNGDNISATSARLNVPSDLALDSGNLYIADINNHRIRKVNLATNIITTVAGTGASGFNGDNISATSTWLNQPAGLALDSGNLYIGEFLGHRVRKVNLATGIISTVAGTGAAGFSGDGGQATAAQINSSRSITLDGSGNLYISEFGNNRVRRLNVNTPINVDPDTLNITSSQGKWVTAYIQLPAGRDASDVNLSSVVLQAIDPTNGAVRTMSGAVLEVGRAPGSPKGFIDTNEDAVPDQLMLKFDRATVASWATGAPELVLRVEGQFNPPMGSAVGTYFSGDTQIRGIYPPNPSPSASSQACDPDIDPCCVPEFAEENPESCPAL